MNQKNTLSFLGSCVQILVQIGMYVHIFSFKSILQHDKTNKKTETYCWHKYRHTYYNIYFMKLFDHTYCCKYNIFIYVLTNLPRFSSKFSNLKMGRFLKFTKNRFSTTIVHCIKFLMLIHNFHVLKNVRTQQQMLDSPALVSHLLKMYIL